MIGGCYKLILYTQQKDNHPYISLELEMNYKTRNDVISLINIYPNIFKAYLYKRKLFILNSWMSNKLTMLTQYLLTLTNNNDTSDFATLVTSLLTSFSPGSTCWAPGWVADQGGDSGTSRIKTERQLSNHKRLRNSPIAFALVSAIDQLSTSGSEAGAGLQLTWRRGSGLAMASDRGWGRRGETFWATVAGHPFRNFLQFILCFQFPRRKGKSGLLVRRIIRNDAVSSLEVYEQGSVRSLFDFGANILKRR